MNAEINIDIEPEEENGNLLVSGYSFSGPASFESHILGALAGYAHELGKDSVVINSTHECTEAVLESFGFEIVEEYEHAGLVTGVLELPLESDTLEEKALSDLDAIAEIADHAQAEVETGDLDGLVGSVDAIAGRASAWSDPQ